MNVSAGTLVYNQPKIAEEMQFYVVIKLLLPDIYMYS